MQFTWKSKDGFNRKERQHNRKLLSQLDYFDRYIIIGDAVSGERQNIVVNNGLVDCEFTVNDVSNPKINENAVKVQTLRKRVTHWIDREMGDVFDMFEYRIQNSISTVIDKIITLRIELRVRSKNASSGQYASSVRAISCRKLSQHVCEACRQTLPTRKNIPGPSKD